MAVNKVIYAGNTLVDLTDATASASDIASGKTAYGANGAKITGTAEGGMVTSEDVANATGTTCAISGDEVEVEPLTVTANGTYTASGVDGYTPVTVNVPTGTARTASDVTASGATVTVPAGLYSSQVQKSVSNGTLDDIEIQTTDFEWSINGNGVLTVEMDEVFNAEPVSSSGWIDSASSNTVFVYGTKSAQLSTQAAATITPTESEQTAVAAGKYTTGVVKVGAISSTYVGSGITSRSSTDLTASGATVTVPAGYYASQATKSVSSGTAGTPTATKGTVSNHSVSVTPSVTNTTGYITGSTKTGTAVTVAASELVSGTYTISASGTHNVTNYASASVAAGSATASVIKGGVNNHSITVTSLVTKTAGYITAGSVYGTAVTVQASELVSGTLSVTENGTADVTNYASVEVNVSGGSASLGTKNITANGTYAASSDGYDGYSSVTVNVPTGSGGGGSASDAIRFIDYDGTIVASYSEVPASLPANPTHSGLTAQGWNYTLAEISEQFAAAGSCVIGQKYVTSDGKTRIHVTITEITKSPWLGIAPNGTVTVDWGDGSATDTLTGTSLTMIKTVQHAYAAAGSYVIALTVDSGSFAFYSNSNSYTRLLGKNGTTGNYYNQPYGDCVTAIEMGSGAAIGTYGLCKLANMRTLTIPDGVTSIGNYAFYNCYALESLTIPDGVTSIGTYVFQYCYALESVTIPDGVTSIGTSAFGSCYALQSLTIPDSVTSIGNGAFSSCYALESLTMPDGAVLANLNFQNCYSLEELNFSASSVANVTSIGNNAFYNCYALESLTIPDDVTSIGGYAFCNCYALESLAIPDGVTSIGTYVFSNCYALESLTIPDDVTSIGTYAFNSCYALESVTIPDGVTSIGNNAFSNCYALQSLTIPDSVTSIGNNAFSNCYNIDEYHFLATTPPTLGTTAFTNIQSGCKIYVPSASLSDYQSAANWSTYASYMVGE